MLEALTQHIRGELGTAQSAKEPVGVAAAQLAVWRCRVAAGSQAAAVDILRLPPQLQGERSGGFRLAVVQRVRIEEAASKTSTEKVAGSIGLV